MDGVRIAEGGEGVTGAMIRARIWVDGRLAGGLQALLGAPMAAYSGCGEPDGGIGHGKRRSRTGLARVCGNVGLAGGSVADGLRQAWSGMACLGIITVLRTLEGIDEDRLKGLSGPVAIARRRLRLYEMARSVQRGVRPAAVVSAGFLALAGAYIGIALLIKQLYDYSLPLSP